MNQKITFPELVELMARRQGCSKREADIFLRELTALMSEVISSGESLRIAGLGLFKPVWVEARASVNVQTGEPYVIPGHYKLSFMPVKSVRDAVNEPFSCFCAEVLPDDVEVEEPTADADVPVDTNEAFAESADVEELLEEAVYSVGDKEVIEAAVACEDTEKEERVSVESGSEILIEDNADVQKNESSENDKTQHAIENDDMSLYNHEKEDLPKESFDKPNSDAKQSQQIYRTHQEEWNAMIRRERRNGFWAGILVAATIIGVVLLCLYFVMTAKQDNGYRRSVMPVDSVTTVMPQSVDIIEPDSVIPAINPDEILLPVVLTDTVRRGVFLTSLSLKHYGHKAFWVYIYMENKDIIKNPDNVPAGTVVKIPPTEKYGIDIADTDAINKALDIAAAKEWEK